MPDDLQTRLDRAVAALRKALGANLRSCCVYGSVVRGNYLPGKSDINLLLVLGDSTPEAHGAVARALEGFPDIDPFVLGSRGFARSVRAFATKFESIRRHYRLLSGEDLLAGLQSDPGLERFLCEQATRNLRLRLVYAYVTRARSGAYARFVLQNVTPLFVQLSTAARLAGISLPTEFEARIPALAGLFNVDGAALRQLLDLKYSGRGPGDADLEACHARVFGILDAAVSWMESHWND